EATRLAETKSRRAREMVLTDGVRAYSGVGSTLKLLAKACRLALVTSTDAVLLDTIRQQHRFLDLFEIVVVEEDYKTGKPSPEPYRVALERLGLPASKVIAVEDSLSGLRSAKAADLNVIAVLTTSTRETLPGAYAYVSEFREIGGLFGSLS